MNQNRSVIVFEPDLKGHRLEYIHHIYIGALNSDRTFHFVLSPLFNDVKDKFEWPGSDNISIHILEDEEQRIFSAGNGIKAFYNKYRIIKKYASHYKATIIFLVMLIQYLPIIPLFLFSKIKFVGIIYRIYLYNWKKDALKKKISEVIKWSLLSKISSVAKAFILNDSSASVYLNKKYSTSKFAYLPDPYSQITYKAKDKREDLGIDEQNKIFLHFGGLTRRKGTIDILDSLFKLNDEEKKHYTFIFAGEVYKDIKDEFYSKYNKLKDSINILLFDEFCSYEFLNDLCYTCDCILIPYHNTNQSSGIISYAAYYNKPVIGPANGLLGKIIRKYHLGITIEDLSAINNYYCCKFTKTENQYIESHTVTEFSTTIINSL